jgi:protein-tyrosine phosphatase
MTALEYHHLFNDINQAKPYVFLDLRNSDIFGQYHLRHAKNISAEQCLDIELVNAQMSDLRAHINVCITFLTDDSIELSAVQRAIDAATEWMDEAKQGETEVPWGAKWKNVIAVSYINFEQFYAAYPLCSFLYMGSVFPTTKKSIPRKVYPTDILPQFLYLGSFYDANEVTVLRELGITHVVDATSEHLSEATSGNLGLAYLPIAVWDVEGANIAEHFAEVLDFIDAARAAQGKILVHCRAGISRSSTFVMAYLMRAGHASSLSAALKTVVAQRPYVLPNPSFREQLQEYEASLFSTRSFKSDKDMLAYISTINFCWSGIFSLETNFDKIPIIAASQRINSQKLMDEFPAEGAAAENAEKKAKKKFLKRGEKRGLVKQLNFPSDISPKGSCTRW